MHVKHWQKVLSSCNNKKILDQKLAFLNSVNSNAIQPIISISLQFYHVSNEKQG